MTNKYAIKQIKITNSKISNKENIKIYRKYKEQ